MRSRVMALRKTIEQERYRAKDQHRAKVAELRSLRTAADVSY